MIRNYQIHTLQTHGTERKSSHKTSGRQLKQRNQLSLTRQDDCKTRKYTKGMHNRSAPNILVWPPWEKYNQATEAKALHTFGILRHNFRDSNKPEFRGTPKVRLTITEWSKLPHPGTIQCRRC